MAAFGNSLWKTRSSHGRKPLFSSPDDLWSACCEYFDWVEKNPLFEIKVFAHQGAVTQEPVAKMRAMTIQGLCVFLDIGVQTWRDYAARDEFLDVTEKVEAIIKTQKFEGAAAELLNPAIIARELGLKERSEQEISGPGGGPIKTESSIQITAEEAYKRMLNGDP